jgi:hypothetical protein
VKPVQQDLDEIIASLTEMDAEWLDETASKIIATLSELADQKAFDRETLRGLIEKDFDGALRSSAFFSIYRKTAWRRCFLPPSAPEVQGSNDTAPTRTLFSMPSKASACSQQWTNWPTARFDGPIYWSND